MPRRAIEQLLADRIGLDAESLGPRLLDRAVQRRRRARAIDDAADYLRCLKAESGEIQALVEEIVVPETWFFRDERPFAVLLQYIKEQSLPRSGKPLRILSLPCSSGEEPYSIAICLIELGWQPPSFHIDAVDISNHSLDRARQGVYTPHSCRALSQERVDRFFLPHSQGIELKPLVRNAVHFHQGNLLDTRQLSRGEPYHVIFCRNVLIYLTPQARVQAFKNLDRLLAPGGLLYLGHAESPAGDSSHYQPYPTSGPSAYLKRAAARASTLAPKQHPKLPGPVPPAPALPRPAAKAKLTRPQSSTSFHPAPPATAKPPAPFASKSTATPRTDLLRQAEQLANAQQYSEALRCCEQAIEAAGPSARAYHLMGMIHQAEGRLDRAEEFLARAAYLDQDDVEALLTLALLARRRGDQATASRYERQSKRARKKETPS